MAEQLCEFSAKEAREPEYPKLLFHGTRGTAPHTLFRRGGDQALTTGAASSVVPDTLTKEQAQNLVVPDTLTKEQAQNLFSASWDEYDETWFDSECDSNRLITRAQFQNRAVAENGLLRSATCDGLDTRYSNSSSFYGSGLYFSDSALYSDRYAFRTASGAKQVLLCAVLTGRSKDYSGERHHDLRRAPPEYHSVTANSAHAHDPTAGSSRMWVVYSNSQVYTAYILTYSTASPSTY